MLRDSVAAPHGGDRFVAWPKRLRRFLDGRTRVELRSHVDDEVLYDEEHRFGTGDDRISIVDAAGPAGRHRQRRPAAADLRDPQRARRPRRCSTRSSGSSTPCTRSASRPSRPTAPCSARCARARLLGHDSDADLGLRQPEDRPGRRDPRVLRDRAPARRHGLPDRALQRRRHQGLRRARATASVRGLDVFGGFYAHGHLMVMGEIRVPLPESAVFPLGTTTLEGRTLPAPADTDAILTATYGPGWRTPGPGLRLRDPAHDVRCASTTGSGAPRVDRKDWDRRYLGAATAPTRAASRPSWPAGCSSGRPADVKVVDVGCGRGGAARWLARRGLDVLGLDYAPTAYEFMAAWAERGRTLAAAVRDAQPPRAAARARLGRPARPRARARTVLMARHVADAVPRPPGAATCGASPRWRAGRTAGSTSSSSPGPPRATAGCTGSCCTRSTRRSWCASSRERGGTRRGAPGQRPGWPGAGRRAGWWSTWHS